MVSKSRTPKKEKKERKESSKKKSKDSIKTVIPQFQDNNMECDKVENNLKNIEDFKYLEEFEHENINNLLNDLPEKFSCDEFEQEVLISLRSVKCTYCCGIGHYQGQCGTLKNIDSILKKHPLFSKMWSEIKFQNIHRGNDDLQRAEHVYREKLTQRKRKLLQYQELHTNYSLNG